MPLMLSRDKRIQPKKRLYPADSINAGDPPAKGLVGWYIASPPSYGSKGWIDLASGKVATLSGMAEGSLLSGWSTTQRPSGIGQINFDAVDDVVTIQNRQDFYLDKELTITAWINVRTFATTPPNPTPIKTIVSHYDDVNGLYIFLVNRGGNNLLEFDHNATIITTSVTPIILNKWTHVAATRLGTTNTWTVSLYIDGLLNATATTATNPILTSASVKPALGDVQGGSTRLFSEGALDAVRFYNIARSKEQIYEIFS